MTVVIDDGAAGYSEGLATGAPLVSTASSEAAPDAIADSAGNLHAVYLTDGALTYLYKPKGAANWQSPVNLGTTGASDPRMVADSAGNLHIVYSNGSDIFLRTRPSGSGTWNAPVQVSTLPSGTSIEPDAAADGLGRVHVVWQDNGSGANDIRYRRLEANGTWSAEITAGNIGDDRTPRVGTNSGGQTSVVWNLWSGNAQEIHHATLGGGGTFNPPERLDNTAFRSVEPDVVVGNDGAIHVAFHDDNDGNWEVAYTRKAPVGGLFSTPAYFVSPGLVDATVSLALAPDGSLHASWQGTGSVFTSRNAGGSWSTPAVRMVEIGAGVTSIAVDGNNRAYVLAQATKAGVTTGGGNDLWSYADPAGVVGRRVFYNNSFFDGNNAAQNVQDDNAIATDKQALLPGGVATFANYTGFSKGLNGVMIDVAGMPAGTTSLSTSDFEFRVGNNSSSGTWALGPAPAAINVRKGAGVGGSDRVVLTWADGAIKKQWLRVQLKANAATGLAAADTFYFGNAIGETGNSASNTFVDGTDFAGVRDNPRGFVNPAPVSFPFDMNRDRFVDATDLAIVRDNPTGFGTNLQLITAPAASPTPTASPWTVTGGSGYEADYRTAAPSSAAGTAYSSYLFTNLPNGTYEIQATWVASASNGSNVPITISVGSGTGRQEFVVNQQVAPVGPSSGGAAFQTLGTVTVTNGAGAYRVFLPGRANGNVVADAVRLYQQPAVQNITSPLDDDDGVGAKEISPDLVADSAGNLHQVYIDGPNSNDNFRVFYRFKAAGSSTWGVPAQIAGTGSAEGAKIARDAANNLHVVYHDANQVWYMKRTSGTWSTPVRLSGTYPDTSPRKALWPNVAADAQGRVHVVWHENTAPAGDSSIYYVFYRIFQGGVWQPTEQVNTTTAANSADPDVAVASDGRAFVTWTGPGSPAPIMFRERNAAGGWQTPFTVDSMRSGGSSVTVDANDNPHIAWGEDSSGGSGGSAWDAAYRARINGVWGTKKVFIDPSGTTSDTKLAIRPDGTMTLMYTDYNDIYLARYVAGVWTTPVRILDNGGATSLSLIYDPVGGAIHALIGAKQLGYTYDNSWDILYYTE